MFLLEKRRPIEADIIIDILKSEKIPYKLRAIRREDLLMPSILLGYDIEIHSDLEHFDYAQKLIKKRMSDINRLEYFLNSPSVAHPIDKQNAEDNKVKYFTIGQLKIKEYKPKKSLLKRFIDWIKNV